jgi:hypothetical protein
MALDSLSVLASSAVEAAPLPLRPRRAFPFCFDDDNILVPDDMLPPYLLAGLRRPLSIGTPPLIVGEADAGTTLVVHNLGRTVDLGSVTGSSSSSSSSSSSGSSSGRSSSSIANTSIVNTNNRSSSSGVDLRSTEFRESALTAAAVEVVVQAMAQAAAAQTSASQHAADAAASRVALEAAQREITKAEKGCASFDIDAKRALKPKAAAEAFADALVGPTGKPAERDKIIRHFFKCLTGIAGAPGASLRRKIKAEFKSVVNEASKEEIEAEQHRYLLHLRTRVMPNLVKDLRWASPSTAARVDRMGNFLLSVEPTKKVLMSFFCLIMFAVKTYIFVVCNHVLGQILTSTPHGQEITLLLKELTTSQNRRCVDIRMRKVLAANKNGIVLPFQPQHKRGKPPVLWDAETLEAKIKEREAGRERFILILASMIVHIRNFGYFISTPFTMMLTIVFILGGAVSQSALSILTFFWHYGVIQRNQEGGQAGVEKLPSHLH